METKSLPIMLFDERTLTPSFGYVFDPKWLMNPAKVFPLEGRVVA